MSDRNQANQQGDDYHQRQGGQADQHAGQPRRDVDQQQQQPQQEQVWQHLQWGSAKRQPRKQDGERR